MDVKTVYQIFRACRLCGAGGGYKMPIIPNVAPINFDCSDIVLRDKIRDCVQLEVSHDDKMPPLICELCVNKVNDFYMFLEMVRNVDRRTRTRLGLPQAPVSTAQGASEGDCILGVTEPVYIIDDDDEPVVTKVTQPTPGSSKDRGKRKNEPSLAAVKVEMDKSKGIRNDLRNLLKDVDKTVSCGVGRGEPATRRVTRGSPSTSSITKELKRSGRNRSAASSSVTPKLEPTDDDDEQPLLVPRSRRSMKIKVEDEKKKTKSPESNTENFTKPGPKSSKQSTSKPGPKSSKFESTKSPESFPESKSTPKPGPKSSKFQPTKSPESFPEVKSSKQSTPKPGPKSSKFESTKSPESFPESKSTPKPGPKSSKFQPTKSPESFPEVKLLKQSTPKPGPKSSKFESTKSPESFPEAKSTPKPGPKSSKFPSTKSTDSFLEVKSFDSLIGSFKSKSLKVVLTAGKLETFEPKPSPGKAKAGKLKHTCSVCGHSTKTSQGLFAHMKWHTVGFTKPDEACNACGEWFSSTEEASAHHTWHRTSNRPYRCRRCKGAFKRNLLFMQHIENNHCKSWPVVPDLECPLCGTMVPTSPLLLDHDCPGLAKTVGHRKLQKKESSNSKRSISAKNHRTDKSTNGPLETTSDDFITPTRITRSDSKATPMRITRKDSIATPVRTIRKESIATPVRTTRKDSIATPVRTTRKDSIATPTKRTRTESATPARITRKDSAETPAKKTRKDSVETPLVRKESSKRKKEAHEVSLSATAKRKKDEAVKIAPSIRKQLLPMYVRLVRCDSLIGRAKGRINVAHIPKNFGFVKGCVYPYRVSPKSVRGKPARWSSDNMVSIGLRNEFYKEEDYVHWDSDLSSEDEEEFTVRPKVKRVDSLTALSLKTIFSTRCLGKVPRKLRRIRNFDTVLNADNDASVINSLADECDGVKVGADVKISDSVKVRGDVNIDDVKVRGDVNSDDVKARDTAKSLDYDSDTMAGPETERVTNADFDTLFKSNVVQSDAKQNDVSSISSVDNVNPNMGCINNNEKVNDSDITDVSMDETTDSLETGFKNDIGNESDTIEKNNLEGFDIDNIIINTDVVLTQASDVKEPLTLNGDDKIDMNGTKDVSFTDVDGDTILKELDSDIGVTESENSSNKVLESDGSDRVNVLCDDFDKSGSKYLERVSDEEFNFDT